MAEAKKEKKGAKSAPAQATDEDQKTEQKSVPLSGTSAASGGAK